MATPHPLTRFVATATVVGLIACGSATVGAPTTTVPAPVTHSAVALATAKKKDAFEKDVLALINKARSSKRKCGSKTYAKAKPLKWNAKLALAAERHSTDMSKRDYFNHTSKSGKSPGSRIKATGYKYKAMGETLAAGYSTPKAVVKAWLKSPGHCKILMSKSFTQVGVGHYLGGGTYRHYITADFAKPKKK
ncbi:MAG: CAP domain-containing protein [Actinobacteria bacterium]|nr:CAP domain-containing protein [Actinomycetota bacterium]